VEEREVTSQLSLLTPLPLAQEHSPTSVAAAISIEKATPRLRAQVLACIRSAGDHGMTDEEVQDRLQMNPSTERPRRIELMNAGFVSPHGERPTRSGRRATVWIAEV
jgi:transcription initiation factor IIE alpha subunit